MFKRDRNMSGYDKFCIKYNFNVTAIAGFIVWKDSFVSRLVFLIVCRLHKETIFENVQTRN
jgi:hypothetical protein